MLEIEAGFIPEIINMVALLNYQKELHDLKFKLILQIIQMTLGFMTEH